jgi:hypothetical protein
MELFYLVTIIDVSVHMNFELRRKYIDSKKNKSKLTLGYL